MASQPKTAFITGGASGIGRALTEHLVVKGWHVFIADRTIKDAEKLVQGFNSKAGSTVAFCAETNVTSWVSQLAAFQHAVKAFNNQIDFVAPIAGIGEKPWLPSPEQCKAMKEGEFEEPNLAVVDVDLRGVLYTIALAVQQFRRQDKDASGWRGKIGVVASVCGIYCVPSAPVYTAAKHGVNGFVRSYGKLLPHESIALSAVCPNLVQTGISSLDFYQKVDKEGLLVPMERLIEAFDDIIDGKESGNLYECGPCGKFVKREELEYLDAKSRRSMELVGERSLSLHYPPA